MDITINATELRASVAKVVKQVRKGEQFMVVYRRRPAFRIVPVGEAPPPETPLDADPLYRAKPVGRSSDKATAAEHDTALYGG